LFVAGLFVTTFERLSHRPIGFSPERLLLLDTLTSHVQQAAYWDQVVDRVRAQPGVESVALESWALLNGWSSNNYLSMHGELPTGPLCFLLYVSPGFLDTMKIPLIAGRDFRADDVDPGVAIVNETFVKTYLNGENPIGKTFSRTYPARIPSTIIGLVRDSSYSEIREAQKPVAYLPFHRAEPQNGPRSIANRATIVVRTAGPNPLALASILRREVPRARSEFRVSNLHTQQELIDAQTVRERLLAMLALFFAGVALLLAAIGLYGVLNYSVVQRRREIGIRLAIGAPAAGIARLVTWDVFAMVLAGAVIGLGIGMASVRSIETLFYQVKATDLGMLLLPALSLFAAALLASLPAVLEAVRIDPVNTLRSE
jgi:predicted permease